jgi:hypothetical protein
MADIEVYTARYEREHGHPPAGRRSWVFTLVSKTGEILYEVKHNEQLIYPAGSGSCPGDGRTEEGLPGSSWSLRPDKK